MVISNQSEYPSSYKRVACQSLTQCHHAAILLLRAIFGTGNVDFPIWEVNSPRSSLTNTLPMAWRDE